MGYTPQPTYFFDEETKYWVPYRNRITGELELDFTGIDLSILRARRTRATEPKRAESEARKVVDYARVFETMTFATKDATAFTGRGPDIVLQKGRVVEVMAPSPYDDADIRKKAEEGVQLVTIYWHGRVRLVHAAMLSHATAGAFKNQPIETP